MVRYPGVALVVVALMTVAGCSSSAPQQGPQNLTQPTVESNRGTAEVNTASFAIAVPPGYVDTSTALGKQHGAVHPRVILAAGQETHGFRATITLQHAPVPGGTKADPSQCGDAGASMVRRPGWTLRSAKVIDGPVGRTCQIELVAPEGVAIITELNRPGETWLITCNHAEGDTAAEGTCRSTLAAFRWSIPDENDRTVIRPVTLFKDGRPIGRLLSDGRTEGTEPDKSGQPAYWVPGPTLHADGRIIPTKGGVTARVEANGDIIVVQPSGTNPHERLFGRISNNQFALSGSDKPWNARIDGSTLLFSGTVRPNKIDGPTDARGRHTVLVMLAAFYLDMALSAP